MPTPVLKSINAFMLLVLALAGAPASASTCSPAPEPVGNWNGDPPVYFYRDIESCRIFSVAYDPVRFFGWREEDFAQLVADFVDKGQRIAFTEQQMAGATIQVLEYFNTGLMHYFLAIPDEWGAIDRGEAGPGWVRTGYSFKARAGLQSPISVNVQRFYGSVSPGPNSHFFTIDPVEARTLQEDVYRLPADQPRWHSEGSPFNVFPVMFGGACAASQVPVYRAFNGGAARGVEPNHRFNTDRAEIEAMLSTGWIDEGIAFCVDAP